MKNNKEENLFRFENLEIWRESISLAIRFFEIADRLQEKKLWRFCDQLRGVGMSIPNNIAESTGSNKVGDQQQCLRVAKKECFEAANILVILELEKLIKGEEKEELYLRIHILSKRIQSYSNSLNKSELKRIVQAK